MMNINRTVRVKICGIADLATAQAAVRAGADAIGFVFAPSRRRVAPQLARQIVQELPPFVAKVGVFVDTPMPKVAEIADFCGLTAVQLCGRLPDDITALPSSLAVIIAIAVGEQSRLPDISHINPHGFLFDTFRQGCHGGTGETFDWQLLKDIKITRPMILAGGLNANNVQEAIKQVQPYAVDVSGGVETNGQKDIAKIIQFIQLAKEVSLNEYDIA